MSLVSKSRASLSGLEFRVLSKQLSAALSGSYVSNLYSIGESQLLKMRRGAEEGGSETSETSLVLSPKLGAWITQNPARFETSEFTTSLRSHLLRAKLESVSQVDLDRVLVFSFHQKSGQVSLKLVLELMPPGNILLLGTEDKVILALRESRGGHRSIRRGIVYVPPAQNRASPEALTGQELGMVLERETTLGRALGRGLSIPRRYVDEILARVSRGQEDSAEISEGDREGLLAAVREVMTALDSPSPSLVKADDGSIEVLVIRPMSREVVDSAPSLSILLDKLLTSELFAGEAATGSDGQTAETPSAAGERRASELRATIKELESRQAGLATVATGLRKLAAEVKEASDADEMMAMARAEKLVPGDLVATLDSLAERGGAVLSSAIFDRAKKIETETRDIEAAIKRLRSKLRNETSRGGTARIKPIPLATAKKEWYEKFRWFFTTEGKLAIGGRDAQSNTMLIRRHMENGDRVFHADLFGSPFFLLKGGGGQTEAETRQVAKATVAFSSAWKTGLGAADAYWVEPDQIAAAGPAGEYLAHGSFAIKGKKNFVTKNAVEIAVGIDESGRVVSGPEESIMRVAKAHVALVPSREKSSDTAKKVIHELSPYSNPQVRLGVDDVLRMLPAGGGKIIRRKINRKGE